MADKSLIEQMLERWGHDVDQRSRPQTEQQHRTGQRGEDEGFARIDVLERRNPVIGHGTVDHTLVHPQRIGGAQDQGGRGEECDPEIGLEAGENDEELAHEAVQGRQSDAGQHGEDEEEREQRNAQAGTDRVDPVPERVSGARVEMVPGGGHFTMLEAAARVSGLVAEFAATVSPR